MNNVIKKFPNGSFLEYDTGKFDKWCVYLTDSNGNRNPPRDSDYFGTLLKLSEKYSAQKLYEDFVCVYELVGKQVDNRDLAQISRIAQKYGDDSTGLDIIFTILYMAMISEENKAYTKLGKRIKRLGIYALLIEHKSVADSVNFMRGMNWRQIDALCKEKGF